MAFDAQSFLKNVTQKPGVYQMINEQGEVLYVGKARNLKKRLMSYFRSNIASSKTISMVQQIHEIQTIITDSENEAFLLEGNLIKRFKPKYNVLFRDDKSFPYIEISNHPDFPRVALHRGPKKEGAQYFGPYPDAKAAKETLHFLQKFFKLRICRESVFRNRNRPCLWYQIHRCSGACVGEVDIATYQQAVSETILFLKGKNKQLVARIQKKMEDASSEWRYEEAATYRDLIQHLQKTQAHQHVHQAQIKGAIDVIAYMTLEHMVAIHCLQIREGVVIGQRHFYPEGGFSEDSGQAVEAFLSHYYAHDQAEIPSEILVNKTTPELKMVEKYLSERAQHLVHIKHSFRSIRRQWMDMALENAKEILREKLLSKQTIDHRLSKLQALLSLPILPERIESFDISHHMGEGTLASCVVFTKEGMKKSEHRRYRIEGVTPGDDYAAMEQVLERRFKQAQSPFLPSLVIIDGGKGQVQIAKNILEKYGLLDRICLVGLAKGKERIAGNESIISADGEILEPDSHDAGFLLMLQIRDEAHRFAITGSRQQRQKKRTHSSLEEIDAVGPKRRRALLQWFGGYQALKNAGVEEIAKVPGISRNLALKIYQSLRD